MRVSRIPFILVTLIQWIIIILLILHIKSLTFHNNTIKSSVKASDTVVHKPKFLSQTPQQGLRQALVFYDIKCKDIVYAQAILETGHFKSKLCKENNNLFGLYNSKKKEYYRFKHWSESVVAYKKWIQYRYKPNEDYYKFLERIKYARAKDYTRVLKEIVNDKR